MTEYNGHVFICKWLDETKERQPSTYNGLPFPIADVLANCLLKIFQKLNFFDFIHLYQSCKWVKEFVDENRSLLTKKCPMEIEIRSTNDKNEAENELAICKRYEYLRLQKLNFVDKRQSTTSESSFSSIITLLNQHHISATSAIFRCKGHPAAIQLLKVEKYSAVQFNSAEPIEFPYKLNNISLGELSPTAFDYCLRNYIDKTSFLGLRLNFAEWLQPKKFFEWIKVIFETLGHLKSDHFVCLALFLQGQEIKLREAFPDEFYKVIDLQRCLQYYLLYPIVGGLVVAAVDIGHSSSISHLYSQYVSSFEKFISFYRNIVRSRGAWQFDQAILDEIRGKYFPGE